MLTFISFSLATLACFLAIPVAVFFVEVVAAMVFPSRVCSAAPRGSRRRIVVLVPAHNEGMGLLPALEDIKAQLDPADRILVVADNCTDDTAAVAVAAGANVVERHDTTRKGKGFALAWGVRHLSMEPPEIVIVIDADCRLDDGALDRLAVACATANRPVQALYLMTASDDSPINSRVAEFALRVKNLVRPLGLRSLGLPCQLMGTGMAIPWDLIRSVDLDTEAIVEDLKLGLDLAFAGKPPLFWPSARVTSEFPTSAEGIATQRQRWEQGHIGMIVTAAPRLIFAGIAQMNLSLLALALDIAVPPLSLLALLVVGVFAVAALATWLGLSSAALFVSAASLVGFIVGVFLSWLKWGRDILPPSAILLVASYVIRKLPLYCRILFRRSASQWIRTDRRKA
jgi:cellulose synthase/poly-beta-1,6-N-acetylglucosamine synthase-like glycosyltransferase